MKSIEESIMAFLFVITPALGCEAILFFVENIRLWRRGLGELPKIVKFMFKLPVEKEC